MDDDPEPDGGTPEVPDDELAGAVEDALAPARHDAVMAIWQRTVLGRLDHPGTVPLDEETERLRRLRDGEDPDDPSA